MTEIKVCTFNVKNDNLVKKLTLERIEKSYSTLLKTYQINILATQELIESTVLVLKKKFPEWKILGNNRYGNNVLSQRIKILKKFNEYAAVITKEEVLHEKTIQIPWFPYNLKDLYYGVFKYKSITPRILTDVVINLPDDLRIRILNTHLDCHINSVRKRQLSYILKYVRESNLPVILLGDFNSTLENKLFSKFVGDLENIGIKRVEYNHKTFRKSKYDLPIDHIFISKDFTLKDFNIIDNEEINQYTDHYPLYAMLEIK